MKAAAARRSISCCGLGRICRHRKTTLQSGGHKFRFQAPRWWSSARLVLFSFALPAPRCSTLHPAAAVSSSDQGLSRAAWLAYVALFSLRLRGPCDRGRRVAPWTHYVRAPPRCMRIYIRGRNRTAIRRTIAKLNGLQKENSGTERPPEGQ